MAGRLEQAQTWLQQRIWRERFSFSNRILVGALLLVVVVIIGVIGYMVIEGWSLNDALFMTVITVSTVGYSTVHDLSVEGQRFTIVLTLLGVGVLAYTVTILAEYVVAGELRTYLRRRHMQANINALHDHFIVCGFGRIGRQVVESLLDEEVPLIVIERDATLVRFLEENEIAYIQGDATLDESLQLAGITRAQGLCACLPQDANNLFVVLAAHMLAPGISIVARANDSVNEAKFRVAGANAIINPYSIAGHRMASQLLEPDTAQFVEDAMRRGGLNLRIREVVVTAGSPLAERTLAELALRNRTGSSVLALRRGSGELVTNPDENRRLEAGDVLICLGTEEQVAALVEVARQGLEDGVQSGNSRTQ